MNIQDGMVPLILFSVFVPVNSPLRLGNNGTVQLLPVLRPSSTRVSIDLALQMAAGMGPSKQLVAAAKMRSFDESKMLTGSVEVKALLLTSMMLRFRGKRSDNGPLNLFSASKSSSSFDKFAISTGICPEN